MSIDYLHGIRDFELDVAIRDFPSQATGGKEVRVLDLGAGTGRQAARLQQYGYSVIAVDMPSSAYANARIFPVQDYDGKNIPVEAQALDVVFSSNVLEHVADLDVLLAETRRVLSRNGVAVHVLPTPAWRIWTTLTHFPWLVKRSISTVLGLRRTSATGPAEYSRGGFWADLFPRRHGERGNAITEAWYFSSRWWSKAFARAGFVVLATRPAGIFYTGSLLFGPRLRTDFRQWVSRFLGSSCRIYVLRPAGPAKNLSSSANSES
ncbi:class I SAM-dependent methyltransferase [Arenimonas sp.]|uniref:class I SAM-dependent methyltransferase n=1 Tax=Arenimonas sp. TaxID=1872635 RepID=UPI002E348180|nr:class I SAM-dependent methyltransferase [Arenimonas sp.]HEX4853468.1 class I SAM-dependent methyltransferase [Arenimonas sp.]